MNIQTMYELVLSNRRTTSNKGLQVCMQLIVVNRFDSTNMNIITFKYELQKVKQN